MTRKTNPNAKYSVWVFDLAANTWLISRSGLSEDSAHKMLAQLITLGNRATYWEDGVDVNKELRTNKAR